MDGWFRRRPRISHWFGLAANAARKGSNARGKGGSDFEGYEGGEFEGTREGVLAGFTSQDKTMGTVVTNPSNTRIVAHADFDGIFTGPR